MIDTGLQEYQAARLAYRSAKKANFEAEDNLQRTEEAQEVIQAVAAAMQHEAHTKIARIVTRCLATVFEDPYEFRLNFERKRGKTEAKPVFVRNGLEVDPLDASGGGVVDVAAFAARLACLVLSRPTKRKLLVLDEPFKFVDDQVRARVGQLLETLAAEMGVQIIMVTHIGELKIGKVIEL